MNTIVRDLLKNTAADAQTDVLNTMALFCGVGLLASVCMMSLGFEVSAGIF